MTNEEVRETREVLQKQIDRYGQEYDVEGFAIDVKETIGTVMTRIKKAEGEE